MLVLERPFVQELSWWPYISSTEHCPPFQVVLVNLKDLSCFPVSVATLIGDDSGTMERTRAADSDEEGDDDEVLPDVNILPDNEEMGDME